jgi:hypothetical protein
VRGLESSAPRQLALPVQGGEPLAGVWESLSPAAQERILRLLAASIARLLADTEQQG